MNVPRHLVIVAVALAAASCVAPRPAATPSAGPLRVGVSPANPPYVFSSEGRLSGLEVDFARELATALGRQLELVPIGWEQQIRTLLDGRTDIIMSGMTITRAREVTIAFTQPYLRSGLLALVRRGDETRYPTAAAVVATRQRVGVIGGTTGERFGRDKCPNATLSVYPTPGAAVVELTQNRIDLFIHDAPVVLWALSRDEGGLAAVLAPLDEEPLGWGVRRGDEDLRAAADAALARWRTDGTRDRILTRWLPYWQRLEQETARRR
jgi:ABC-type amino acid transport substrate-binding protein